MRVLVADDDATSRVLLKAMASKLGHDCLVASDGSSAWELLQRGDIDVLLTDWMMPGVDGTELCRRVRQDLTDSYTYIVIVTGLADPEQILEGMIAGADDYIIKPVNALDVQTCLVAAQRVTVAVLVVEDDHAAAQFRMTARTVAGVDYDNQYAFFFRCSNGRIAEIWENVDTGYVYAVFGIDPS